MTYSQFSNRFTRLLNKAFSGDMWGRFCIYVSLNGEDGALEGFSGTMNMFGDEDQCDAYDKLRTLIRDNPDYSYHMHKKYTK